MENLYSCRKCIVFSLCVWFIILSTEADDGRYTGPESVEEGMEFEVKCHVSEFEPVKWTLNRGTVPGDSRWERLSGQGQGQVVSVLRVSSATAAHTGEYRCSSFLPDPGHRVLVTGAAAAVVQVNQEYENGGIKYITFEYRTSLELKCNVTVQNEKTKFSWLKDGKDWSIAPADGTQTATKDMSTVTFNYPVDKDAGVYSCVVTRDGGAPETANITAVLKPFVKLQPNTNVVEGEKLILTCIVHGSPVPKISWNIGGGNQTYTETREPVRILDFKDKEKGDAAVIPNGILQIEEATMDHRNQYSCTGVTTVGGKTFNSSSETYVRVKDKMAALWPFLGICLEVVVLCTVILIYEKKRNKTEMEESDTDGSPDQKNTPDHGKDSEVRHRK